MEQIILSVFTAPVLIFCVMVYFVTKVVRKAFELRFENIKDNKYWRELFLPLGPIGTGMILAAVFYGYPFPEAFSESFLTRGVLGVVCGGASGLVYRIFKALFPKNKSDNKIDSEKDQ